MKSHDSLGAMSSKHIELAMQTVPCQSLNERQVIARLMKHQAEEIPKGCQWRVPQFAGLMEACWRRHEERPEASGWVEVLAEVRGEYSEEGASKGLVLMGWRLLLSV